jgi:hypothetical protein
MLDTAKPLFWRSVMGRPIVWLASAASGVHDERIVATEFAEWLRERSSRGTGIAPEG